MEINRALSFWRSCLLGAANGLFSTALLIVLDGVNSYYAGLRCEAEVKEYFRLHPESTMDFTCAQSQPLWWTRAACLNILLFVLVSIIAHRYLAKRIKSVFLLWQSIGIAVVGLWLLIVPLITGIESMLTGAEFSLKVVYSPTWRVFAFIVLVLAINVVYSTIMQVSAKHYSLCD